ncbi:MAG: 4-alpha-glucanotransferase [Candidatus Omnitrophica bacterium]|nr:4-alpha-glucanotransferase [Candidatus Omnitrophota bacterium]
MLNTRSNGILCHVSSLPSDYGIGDLGPQAYKFVDLLAAAGQKWWQVLPLNPTDNALGNSPYSSFSAFAFNSLFISPEQLVIDGFLDQDDIALYRIDHSDKTEYDLVYKTKSLLIDNAFAQFRSKGLLLQPFADFCRDQAGWLDDFALFVVIKKLFAGAIWVDWPIEFRDRSPAALEAVARNRSAELEKEKFAQFLFFHQWTRLKTHCSACGVGIIGDIPMYVNYDSADVWTHPEFFKLDEDKRQTFVAGVPPDYFSAEGQRWGNPVYDWDKMRSVDFSWWVARVRHNLTQFSAVRVDHFRAFAQCWEIPVQEKTAINGLWQDVPGREMFEVLHKTFSDLPIIAEDLGIITPDVDALKDHFKFPGMRVVMFAFHNDFLKSRDLPANYTTPAVVYTGTHDNNTVRGWFEEDMTIREKENYTKYFNVRPTVANIHWRMIRMAMGSVADVCIIPLQDILGLGSAARMNRPSVVKGNWSWRLAEGALVAQALARLKRLTLRYKR